MEEAPPAAPAPAAAAAGRGPAAVAARPSGAPHIAAAAAVAAAPDAEDAPQEAAAPAGPGGAPAPAAAPIYAWFTEADGLTRAAASAVQGIAASAGAAREAYDQAVAEGCVFKIDRASKDLRKSRRNRVLRAATQLSMLLVKEQVTRRSNDHSLTVMPGCLHFPRAFLCQARNCDDSSTDGRARSSDNKVFWNF